MSGLDSIPKAGDFLLWPEASSPYPEGNMHCGVVLRTCNMLHLQAVRVRVLDGRSRFVTLCCHVCSVPNTRYTILTFWLACVLCLLQLM